MVPTRLTWAPTSRAFDSRRVIWAALPGDFAVGGGGFDREPLHQIGDGARRSFMPRPGNDCYIVDWDEVPYDLARHGT